jgi:hypothetical protein
MKINWQIVASVRSSGYKTRLKFVGSNLVSSLIQDGNGVKAVPGLFPAPNSGSFENKKNTGSQMEQTKKK